MVTKKTFPIQMGIMPQFVFRLKGVEHVGRSLYLLLILMCVWQASIAQEVSTDEIETKTLGELIITGEKYSELIPGNKVESYDSIELQQYTGATLTSLLQEKSAIYIKEYGSGQLANISFRGTTASHTAIYWHGINLNSLTLGEGKANHMPMFLFDGVELHYGGSSSVMGSGAIGGSIHLQTGARWIPGTRVVLQQDFGSYGKYFTGAKVTISKGNWESATKLYHFQLENNFPYETRQGESIMSGAGALSHGLLQEVSYKLKNDNFMSAKLWYGYNWNEVQNEPAAESGDTYIRALADYKFSGKLGELMGNVAYVNDHLRYINGGEESIIQTTRGETTLTYQYEFNTGTFVRTGGNYKYIVPKVYAYHHLADQWEADVYLSVLQKWHWVELSGNLRQPLSSLDKTSLAPSLALVGTVPISSGYLDIRSNIERSYCLPTYNDRFWQKLFGDGQWKYLGRPDLKVEHGWGTEFGLKYESGLAQNSTFDVSVFYKEIDDMIVWEPNQPTDDGLNYEYRPNNKKAVEIRGLEMTLRQDFEFGRFKNYFGGSVSYLHSILQMSHISDDPAIGHQLPYIPKLNTSIFLTSAYRNFSFRANLSHTGKRTGQDVINDKLDAYTLVNLSGGYLFAFGHHKIQVTGTANNIFDTRYFNMKAYHMPGRNYLISIKYYLN